MCHYFLIIWLRCQSQNFFKAVTNTLAYYIMVLITAVKSFVVQALEDVSIFLTFLA